MYNSPTYAELFAFLVADLGFRDVSTNKFERVFEHTDSSTVLLFSMMDDADEQRPVRTADLLSAQVHLEGKGLVSSALEALIGAQVETRNEEAGG
jgi:hypothetical protein